MQKKFQGLESNIPDLPQKMNKCGLYGVVLRIAA
jgi:hypothetical protein